MPNTPNASVWLARIAISGTVFFGFVMYVAFLFIQPELNPIYRFGSEYSAGRMGWLMKLAFYVWSIGLLAFAAALATGLDAESRSYAAITLFTIGALGIFFAGVFDSDLQILNENPPPRWVEGPASNEHIRHVIASFIGLPSLMAGIGFATRRLRIAGRLRSTFRLLRLLSWATPAAFVALATLFVPFGLAGLGQRIFLALLFTWIIIAARGITTGAFLPRS